MLHAMLDQGLLACPTCRGVVQGVFHDAPLALAEVLEERGGRLWQAFLVCSGCGTRYPVIDGVPVVMKDVAGWLRQQERSALWREDLSPALSGWLRAAWSDHDDPNWKRELLATYARGLAPADQVDDDDAFPAALRAQRLATRDFLRRRQRALIESSNASPLVLDMGAGVGIEALDMVGAGAQVVALEREFGPLRLLSQLLLEGHASVPRWRHGGMDYLPARVELSSGLDPSRLLPIAADALEPPFRGGIFALVTAYNLLDNVTDPIVLLRQAHGLLGATGALALSSPYDWNARCTPLALRLGASIRVAQEQEPDPARALRDLLVGRFPALTPGLRFEIEHETERMPWLLQRHERSWHVFLTHYVEARRVDAGSEPGA